MLEAYFWSFAIAPTRWQSEFPSIKALFRRVQLDPQKDPSTYQMALTFEECNDVDIPFTLRLSKIETMLNEVSRIEKIDKQLLCWLAICRWLSRHKSFQLARLVMAEYVGLCLKMTEGSSQDIFGIAADIPTKAWYQASSGLAGASDSAHSDGEEDRHLDRGDSEAEPA